MDMNDLDLEPYAPTGSYCPVCGGPVEAEHGYLTEGVGANEIVLAVNARCTIPSCIAHDPEMFASLVGDSDD